MGFFQKLLGKATAEPIITDPEKNVLYLPIEGTVITLKEINDGVFSEEILGKGCGILPHEEKVCAPVNGTITNVAETKHAIGIMADDGMEILIHVGMDTVDMKGQGFNIQVSVGQKVKCGQLLMTFNSQKIKAAGHPTSTAFVLTNTDEFASVELLQTGKAKRLTPVLKVINEEN